MLNARVVKAASAALLVSLSLTACDPPIPPGLLALQAEIEVQCEEGEVTTAFPESMTDLALTWSESLLVACENMALTNLGVDANEPDLLVS